jgi:HK97 gp10 family phage protein
MPGAISRIEGMREAREALQELSKAAQTRLGNRALERPARVFVRRIKAKAAVSGRPGNPTPGSLRESIRDAKARKERGRPTRVILAEDVAAVPNEFGRSKMAAQPFFKPAIDEGRDEAGGAMADGLREEVDAEVRRIAKG